MKRFSLLVALLLCVSLIHGQTQDRERLVYEPPGYFAYDFTDPVRWLLFGNGGIYTHSQVLLQTVCIPSFEPPWVVHLYNPETFTEDSLSGLTRRDLDTTQVIVEAKRAAATLTIERMDYKALGNKATISKRPIPKDYVPEIMRAFTATLALAHWPTDGELVQVDGKEYHFTVCSGTRRRTTYMWAVSHAPSSGTRTHTLAELAAALVRFAETSNDSAASAALGQVRTLARQLAR